MLSRYRIIRGKRPGNEPLPTGQRHDTRKHTRHLLRPDPDSVARFLADPSPRSFVSFRTEYLSLLSARYRERRNEFDELAELARRTDVYLGCNCPTSKQPDVHRCHTTLALSFFAQHYPDLSVEMP